MPLHTAADIPMLVVSSNASSERRISPAWSIAQLKARLYPITGISASTQRLSLRLGGSQQQPLQIQAHNEDATQLSEWPLQAYAEIHVTPTDPTSSNANPTFSSAALASVEKYTMPTTTYESLPSTVRAYKAAHGIGRFDPNAPATTAAKVEASNALIDEGGIEVGKRCQILPAGSDGRRGVVAFVGLVAELPGLEGMEWVGVRLDEPVGKNDGSVTGGKRYFEAGRGCGVFLRPEKVECGDFGEVGLVVDSDLEEI